jgi:hypothetical protein
VCSAALFKTTSYPSHYLASAEQHVHTKIEVVTAHTIWVGLQGVRRKSKVFVHFALIAFPSTKTHNREGIMKHIAVALALLAASAGASATDSPLAGTWKLNVDKSTLAGQTLSYTTTATGFHYSNGSTVKFDFALDGKDYQVIPGRTVSWTKSGDNSWDSVYKNGKGTVIAKVHRTLSADGKTMTVVSTDYHADGTTSDETDVRARVSGGPGLAGTWKEVKIDRASNTTVISVPSAGHIKYEIPSEKETIEGAVDGSPSPVQGPTVPEGATMTFKQVTPSKIAWSYAVKGVVLGKGTDTVSSDGKSLTSISWAPGKEAEKTSEVYDKQ